METFIAAADIETSYKKYKNSLSYDELFDIEMEFKIITPSDNKNKKLKKGRTYVQYLAQRYDRHKLKTNEHSNT